MLLVEIPRQGEALRIGCTALYLLTRLSWASGLVMAWNIIRA
jgi:hypothetical protein